MTHVPHTFKISRRPRDGTVVLHYKQYAADDVWLPADDDKGTLTTMPEGIEIFKVNVAPPDPMVVTPSEVQF